MFHGDRLRAFLWEAIICFHLLYCMFKYVYVKRMLNNIYLK